MKHILVVLFFCCSFLNNPGYAQCDSTLWNHVYNSYRLIVYNQCMTVSGTIYSLINEADGDKHIRLTLDSPYTYMLNAVNYSGQYGKLVCEPLCATTCTQPDAIASCTGFTNTVFIPSVGEHVYVTGSFVKDNDHGWNEIHPVTSISFTTTGVGSAPTGKSPEIKVFPNPATSKVTFRLSEKLTSPVYITILDEVGRLGGQYQMLETTNLEVNTKYLPSGKYYYHIEQNNKEIQGGSFVVKER
ncbi:MAG: T9SS type A sorting domain-containing protein [Chitinophagales bacterium]